jgi:hypothetical protein
MKSSYVLILLIIGIIILHAIDDRKQNKVEKAGKKSNLVNKSTPRPGIDPSISASF